MRTTALLLLMAFLGQAVATTEAPDPTTTETEEPTEPPRTTEEAVVTEKLVTEEPVTEEPWDPEQVAASLERASSHLDDPRKLEALEKIKEILGIRGKLKGEERKEQLPPQFMMELYNTVTDTDGRTRGSNPYNAQVVRSFIERNGSSSNAYLYVFNVSGLEPNEVILEAELHLYRKRSSPRSMHPSVLSSPHYLIKVYQVLQDRSLEEPDLHRLLNVHYVGAYASGWQVFNVKQAVLSWLSGAPNLGLLVTGTTIFGDRVTVEFSRREEEPGDKQPILVLFNDDGRHPPNGHISHKLTDAEEEAEQEAEAAAGVSEENETPGADRPRIKRDEELMEEVAGERPVHFRREKKPRRQREPDENDIDLPPRFNEGIIIRRRTLEQTLTSMDVYQRAMLRERLAARKKSVDEVRKLGDEAANSFRKRRSVDKCPKLEADPCAKRELYVNFRDIGLTTIIAPEGYAAYQCRGHCKSPLSQEQKPTNHATIQGIIHKMNLAPGQDVEMPCCVPVNLSSISILYLDDEREGVVLKSYADMAVVSCGCR